MKRYCIKYLNKDSQHTKTTYCVGDSDLHATLVDLVVDGNFIDWIGEKDENDTIGHFHEVKIRSLLVDLDILKLNDKNEEESYNAWGMYEVC